MNLPAIAIEFLPFIDQAYSTLNFDLLKSIKLPTIFCYCFITTLNDLDSNSISKLPLNTFTFQQAKQKVYDSFSFLVLTEISFFDVRKVAPNKSMFCIQINFQHSLSKDFKRSSILLESNFQKSNSEKLPKITF